MNSDSRRSFLLSMTLTELALILFFLLLLLSTLQLQRKDDQIHALTSAEPGLVAALPAISQWYASAGDQDFVKLVRQAQENQQRADQRSDEVTSLREDNEELASRLSLETDKAENLAGQLRNLQNQCQEGVGPPPCWADPETGRAQYIYRVIVRERDLEITRAWPDSRERDLTRIPGAHGLLSESIAVREFADRAAQILAWSKGQDPECRHYVLISDQAESKDGYKKKRLVVEDFFYKYEERQ